MRASSIVLLSGGLDSLASLYWSIKESDVMVALTFDYGQRAGNQEIQSASKLCKSLDIKHKIIELPWFKALKNSALLDSQAVIPEINPKDLDNMKVTLETAKAVWVPNRNGVMINVGAAIAEAMVANWVVVGFNKEEGKTFPDNSEDYLKALNKSFVYSTKGLVSVKAPMVDKNKKEIVEWCVEHDVDFTHLWSCYRGGDKMCGVCESCRRCQRALEVGGASTWIKKLF